MNTDWADSRLYQKEICFIAKRDDIPVRFVRIDNKTFGEPVVFIRKDGEWVYAGYLDDEFYSEMEENK